MIGQFVDGVLHAVGLDDEVERIVAAANLDQLRLAEPFCGIQHRNVAEFPTVECCVDFDKAHEVSSIQKLDWS